MPVRSSTLAIGITGILGVIPTDQEIVGVYPTLSATKLPHAQEIRFRRGETLDLPIQIQDDQDPPDKVALLNAVIRFAAKQTFGTGYHFQLYVGDRALVAKRSYDSSEIEFTSDSNGQAILHVSSEDTEGLPAAPAVWGLEVIRPTTQIAVPTNGKANFLEGSDMVQSSGFCWTDIGVRAGDLILAQGRTVLVLDVPAPTVLQTDFNGWAYEAQAEICLYHASSKVVASGPFEVLGTATR